ncbi:hypothetical protein [Sphingomonas sp. R1]|uniref:hypothetical protein n=1 Tax=Sphingomonas sp. R1 TaxID=399176 RepID=UPI0022254085|nr:hypothetical protein [Sphingomonas sp. R1]UYY78311.1 hypothetical protein OIM94_04720 [Sphingomonas sp. R1]
MKLFQLLAIAGFAATGLAGATSAQAQDWRYRDRHEQRYDRYDRYDRHDRWDRHHRWDRDRRPGWDRGYGYRGRPNCWEEWRYGRPVRVCRR